ncbi:hypothetical protein [Actinomadura sp. DC4]|nr:hypothetical protein [Actinomadura sp. DC4]MDN3357151.1 hypothetical protein [Actinomadura sp. DC4]
MAKRIADDGPMVVIGRLDSLLLFMPLLVAALAWAGLLVARRRR